MLSSLRIPPYRPQPAMLLRQTASCSAMLAVALLSTQARAGISDTITPYVSAQYSYEDNLFRMADDAPGGVLSDYSKAIIAGLNFERPVGRQVFTAAAKVTKVSFDRFTQLNYSGKDFSTQWRWQLGNDFNGNIGGSYVQSLSSFSDFQSTERDLRVQRGVYADGGWQFFPHWRVRGRVSRDQWAFDLVTRQYLDRTENVGEVGLDYLASTRSSVGLVGRRIKGRYDHPPVFGPFSYDQSYIQDELKLRVLWNFDDRTQVQFLGGRARRNYEQLTNRNSSGSNGRLTANWSVVPTIRLTGELYREFAAYEGSAFTYSLNTGKTLSAQWSLSSKLALQGDTRWVKRDFSGLVLNNAAVSVSDDTRTSSLALTYSVRNNIQLGVSAFRDVRAGVPHFTSSYRANGASVNATVQF